MRRLNEYLNRFVHSHMAELDSATARSDTKNSKQNAEQVLARELSRSFASLRWFR